MNYEDLYNEAYNYFLRWHRSWSLLKIDYYADKAATRLLKEEYDARKSN